VVADIGQRAVADAENIRHGTTIEAVPSHHSIPPIRGGVNSGIEPTTILVDERQKAIDINVGR